MRRTSRGRVKRLAALTLAAALLVAALPFGGSFASAAGMQGAFFVSGNPPFSYVITGLRVDNGADTVKLYQDENMQSYRDYTGEYDLPEQVYDRESMTFYTVNEIGGAIGESIPGALENVPARRISLPGTVTTIGSRAFANSGLRELTFPTSVTRLAGDAFLGVTLQELTLAVTQGATMSSNMAYTPNGSAVPVVLPRTVSSLSVQAPLALSGSISVSGDVDVQKENILVHPSASLTVEGNLSGAGLIEVSDTATLTLNSVSGFSGRIHLVGPEAELVNRGSMVITAINAEGKEIEVTPGETSTGETPVAPPADDPALYPQITATEGGVVTVLEKGRVVEITPDSGYKIGEVIINGYSMGAISRYEFAEITASNTVNVTFVEGDQEEGPSGPNYFVDVSAASPYAEAIGFLVSNGICSGVGGGRFAPGQKVDRATLLFLMKQLERYDADFVVKCKKPSVPFEDVPENTWYYDAVGWAVGTGIWNRGVSLHPGRPITREEFALTLYRYTHARGYAAYQEAGRYHAYVDSTLLVYESRQAMTWAATTGYLKVRDRRLNPAGSMTRGEIAQALAMYLRIN